MHFCIGKVIDDKILYSTKTLAVEILAGLAVHDQSTKLYLPKIIILADLRCKAANPPMLFLPKRYGQQSSQVSYRWKVMYCTVYDY